MSSNTKDNRKPFEFFYDDGEYWFVHEDGETENVEHLGDMAGCYVEVAAAFERLLGEVEELREKSEAKMSREAIVDSKDTVTTMTQINLGWRDRLKILLGCRIWLTTRVHTEHEVGWSETEEADIVVAREYPSPSVSAWP